MSASRPLCHEHSPWRRLKATKLSFCAAKVQKIFDICKKMNKKIQNFFIFWLKGANWPPLPIGRIVVYLWFGRYCPKHNQNTTIMNNSSYLESPEERRARRNQNIKKMFQSLTIQKGLPCMDAYEITGYYFYLSAMDIRRIIASLNKSVHGEHWLFTKNPYLCTVIRKSGGVLV